MTRWLADGIYRPAGTPIGGPQRPGTPGAIRAIVATGRPTVRGRWTARAVACQQHTLGRCTRPSKLCFGTWAAAAWRPLEPARRRRCPAALV